MGVRETFLLNKLDELINPGTEDTLQDILERLVALEIQPSGQIPVYIDGESGYRADVTSDGRLKVDTAPFNYIIDNPLVVLTRDVNDRVVTITLTTALGAVLTKTIARDGAGLITNVSKWTT